MSLSAFPSGGPGCGRRPSCPAVGRCPGTRGAGARVTASPLRFSDMTRRGSRGRRFLRPVLRPRLRQARSRPPHASRGPSEIALGITPSVDPRLGGSSKKERRHDPLHAPRPRRVHHPRRGHEDLLPPRRRRVRERPEGHGRDLPLHPARFSPWAPPRWSPSSPERATRTSPRASPGPRDPPSGSPGRPPGRPASPPASAGCDRRAGARRERPLRATVASGTRKREGTHGTRASWGSGRGRPPRIG